MSDNVLCFDPEKVLSRLSEHFQEAYIDETDYAEAEVRNLTSFLAGRGDEISDDNGSRMLASIKRKARQNGPAFVFRLDSDKGTCVSGWARRYGVGFQSEGIIQEDLRARIINFLEGLGVGEVEVS